MAFIITRRYQLKWVPRVANARGSRYDFRKAANITQDAAAGVRFLSSAYEEKGRSGTARHKPPAQSLFVAHRRGFEGVQLPVKGIAAADQEHHEDNQHLLRTRTAMSHALSARIATHPQGPTTITSPSTQTPAIFESIQSRDPFTIYSLGDLIEAPRHLRMRSSATTLYTTHEHPRATLSGDGTSLRYLSEHQK